MLNICQRERLMHLTLKVMDETTGEILPDAHVYFAQDHLVGGITNSQGIFTMEIPYNTELIISYVGYHEQRITPTVKYVEVYLKMDDTLDTVVITNEPKPKPVKKCNNWLWLLALGGVILIGNSSKGNSSTKKKPINAKI